MYRCGVCGNCSQPRQQRYSYAIYRDVPAGTQRHVIGRGENKRIEVVETPPRKDILREIEVCKQCYGMLCQGVSIQQIREMMRWEQDIAEMKDISSNHSARMKKRVQDWASQAVPFRSVKT